MKFRASRQEAIRLRQGGPVANTELEVGGLGFVTSLTCTWGGVYDRAQYHGAASFDLFGVMI